MEQLNVTQCPTLNGNLVFTIGVFEDTCTFFCNAGYELQGSNNGTCLADQSWSRVQLQLCLPSLHCRRMSMTVPSNTPIVAPFKH